MNKQSLEYPAIIKGVSFMTAHKVRSWQEDLVRLVIPETNGKFSVIILGPPKFPAILLSTLALFDTKEEADEYLDKLVAGCIRFVEDTHKFEQSREPKGTVCQECHQWVKEGAEYYHIHPTLTRTHLPTCSQFPVEWAVPMMKHLYEELRKSQKEHRDLFDIQDRMHVQRNAIYRNLCHENNKLRQRLYPDK